MVAIALARLVLVHQDLQVPMVVIALEPQEPAHLAPVPPALAINPAQATVTAADLQD